MDPYNLKKFVQSFKQSDSVHYFEIPEHEIDLIVSNIKNVLANKIREIIDTFMKNVTEVLLKELCFQVAERHRKKNSKLCICVHGILIFISQKKNQDCNRL